MEKSLTEELNKTATAAHDAFPKELENFFVLNLPSGTLIYAADEIVETLTKETTSLKRLLQQTNNLLHTKNIEALAVKTKPIDGKIVKLIALKDNLNKNFSTQPTPEKMEIFSSLEHEIGHFVVENGTPTDKIPKHINECAAKAYELFRHIQQFGKETDYLENQNLAHTIVLNMSPINYTNDIVQRVKQLSEEMDISSLSLQEISKLAEKVALEYSLDDKTLKKINSAFLPTAAYYEKNKLRLNNKTIESCRKKMLFHKNDPDIYKAGERFLNHPDVKKHLEKEATTSHFWKGALNFIKNHSTKSKNKDSAPKPPEKKAKQIFQAPMRRS